MILFDTHTHAARPCAAVCIDPVSLPAGFEPAEGLHYSVAIHPWNVHRADAAHLAMLDALARNSAVIAIGETGLDANAEASREEQAELLRHHISLSEQTAKPLVLHMVRGWDELLRLRKEMRPSQPWIVHGFRGKPELARRLVAEGLYLSYGERFNPASVAATPPGRLLAETDESELSLAEIVSRLGVVPRVSLAGLCGRGVAPQSGELGALDCRASEEG